MTRDFAPAAAQIAALLFFAPFIALLAFTRF